MDRRFIERGFLPTDDPLQAFGPASNLSVLDELGRDLPDLLERADFRAHIARLRIPLWEATESPSPTTPALRLYYLRLGFLASGYVNHLSEPRATLLPRNIAVPLARVCALLGRPPILSYDGYALYNWRRLDPSRPIALGNIETLQNFVRLYDEHWFILVHVEIEAKAIAVLDAVDRALRAAAGRDADEVSSALVRIAQAVREQTSVLRRIPEKMDPSVYYRTFRPYIRFFQNVVYEGIADAPMNFRGETGAQSSIMPALVAFMKIPHARSLLTDHLTDMRRFMPPRHRALLEELDRAPSVRGLADPRAYNAVLDEMALFREVHLEWAKQYVSQWEADPRGTGGTPYLQWLKQLVDETRQAKVQASPRQT